MAQKPAGLLYGVGDTPPLGTSLVLAFQHAVLALVFIVYPLTLISESSGTPLEAEHIVTASILVMALGTFFQCLGRWGVGSGYLAVEIVSPVYLPVALQAARLGGLGLACGMGVVSGAVICLFSRFLKPARHLFPAEVCGVGVAMLGISMVGSALPRFLGLHDGAAIEPRAAAVGSLTLALMVSFTVWTTGRLRLYSLLIGLTGGYAAALALGVLPTQSLGSVLEGGWVAVPKLEVPSWKFDTALLFPFLLTGLVASLDTVACVITCQKINDSEWVRPTWGSISGGVLARGLVDALGGGLGTLGAGISSAHIALSSATGATARRIGLLAAALLLVTAFVPPIAKTLARMPAPVMGAVMVYASAFLITSGMELIVSRMLDARRIFTVGGSIVAGVCVLQLPALAAQFPAGVSSIAGSPFAVASLCAVALNLVFRLGTSKTATVAVAPELAGIAEAVRFLERSGAAWGARRQVIQRAEGAVSELLETVVLGNLAQGPVTFQARFDEYNVDVVALYPGAPFPAAGESPSPEQLLDDDGAPALLAGLLLRQYADKATFDTQHGQQRISLHFEH